jgi:hypothetical protein
MIGNSEGQGPAPGDRPSEGGKNVAVDQKYLGHEVPEYALGGLLDLDHLSGDGAFNEIYITTAHNRYAIVPRETVDDTPSDGTADYVLVDRNISSAPDAGRLQYKAIPNEILRRTTLTSGEILDLGEEFPFARGVITGNITAVDTGEGRDELELGNLDESTVFSDFWKGLPERLTPQRPDGVLDRNPPQPQPPGNRSWKSIVSLEGLDEMSARGLELEGVEPTAANQLRNVAEKYFELLGSRYASQGPISPDEMPEGLGRLGRGAEKLSDTIGHIQWGEELGMFTFAQRYTPNDNPPPLMPNVLGLRIGEDAEQFTFTITIPSTRDPRPGQAVSPEQQRPPRFTIGALDVAKADPRTLQAAVGQLLGRRPELAAALQPVQEILAQASDSPRDDDGAYQLTARQMDIIREQLLPGVADPDRMPQRTANAKWDSVV